MCDYNKKGNQQIQFFSNPVIEAAKVIQEKRIIIMELSGSMQMCKWGKVLHYGDINCFGKYRPGC
jgi:hypothetical protein